MEQTTPAMYGTILRGAIGGVLADNRVGDAHALWRQYQSRLSPDEV